MIVTIYMKSGNKIRVRLVKDWKVDYRGNEITGLTVQRKWLARWIGVERLIVPTVDLSQIEAITTT